MSHATPGATLPVERREDGIGRIVFAGPSRLLRLPFAKAAADLARGKHGLGDTRT